MPAISIALYVFLRLIFMAISSASSSRSPEEMRVGQNILKAVIMGQQVLFLLIQAVLLIIALHAGRGPVS
jgi:hypothetical protein